MTKKIIIALFCLLALSAAQSNNTMMANSSTMAGAMGPGSASPMTTGAAAARGKGPNFQPVFTFKMNQLFGVYWYESFYADNQFGLLDACTRYLFTQTDSGDIAYQYGYLEPGLKGEFLSNTLTLRKKKGTAGQFNVITPGKKGSLFVLDYAPNYSWIVIGDSNANFLSVLSKTPMNQAGLQRALDLSQQYDLDSHHLELQDSSNCPYSMIRNQLKKARKNL